MTHLRPVKSRIGEKLRAKDVNWYNGLGQLGVPP